MTVDVTLDGTLNGDDWRASPDATLTTDLSNGESYLSVSIFYAGDESSNRTPQLTGTLVVAGETVTCETARAYIWSSFDPDEAMSLNLMCKPLIYSDEIETVSTVTLAG